MEAEGVFNITIQILTQVKVASVYLLSVKKYDWKF